MEKTTRINELVYFTGKKERFLDMNGEESSLTKEMQFDFLKHYANTMSDWYDDGELNSKVVCEEEINDFLNQGIKLPAHRIRKEMHFDTMTACTVFKEPEYKNLFLYCGAKAENGKIIFADKFVRPTSCAKYELKSPADSLNVYLEVFIPEDYKCTQDEKCGEAQAGRVIEIRTKTLDIVKIKLCNTGEIFSMSEDMWVPVYDKLADVVFGGINTFDITIGEKVSVVANGRLTEGICRTAEGQADNIFFDGGMFPAGGWQINKFIINGEPVSFEKNSQTEKAPEDSREVLLPYAIGGYENRDKRLYLTKKFSVDDFTNAVLKLETLDPYGKVWLNGQLILDADDFACNEINVSNILKKGNNELKVMVEPRPPEVYYFWHRHTDCYNGWFCGKISLVLTQKTYIRDMKVITKEISDNVTANAEIELSENTVGSLELFASESFPHCTKEVSLGKHDINGNKIKLDFTHHLKLWDVKAPNLYCIRAVLYDENGNAADDFAVETGFRTVSQVNGDIYLNNKKIMAKGALLMQFLPPFDEVPINHNCPTDEQIVMQMLALKKMNGNLMRLHILGYGTNDKRFSQVCDRLGIMLIWTTRYIDTIESMVWDKEWAERDKFICQIKEVMNHPSIIVYEGSNEYHSKDLATIDRIYDEFTDAAESVDKSRLLSPCSHLYYGGGLYDTMDCKYYTDSGRIDEKGEATVSGAGWVNERVIRSAHTYSILCGYGESWEAMRKQDWRWQDELLNSKNHSYWITEFAVTGLANPTTPEAKANEYVESYERDDELGPMGRWFTQNEWRESQSYQALCAFNAVKQMRILGADCMAWCCLMSGANNGSYLKPPIDFYGYKKLAYYTLKDAYNDVLACNGDTSVSYGIEDCLNPVIINADGAGKYSLIIRITDETGNIIDKKVYSCVELAKGDSVKKLEAFKPSWEREGYYTIEFELESL